MSGNEVILLLLGALASIAWWFFRKDMTNIRVDIRDLVNEMKDLNKNVVAQNERQNAFEDRLDMMDQRYNMLISDLKELAREHRQCKNFDVRPK